MLQIIDLMSISRPSSSKERRGRISYSALGINQLGAVYEALLSYRGFFAEKTLYEVKRAQDKFNELDVGYFVPESELDNYSEDERVRDKKGQLRVYEKGTFIYRLAGREREKSASYYTPEVLTKCLVKYALKELLEGKTADEILQLTVCEPAMGSAAFLNEVINQLAEAYLDRKEKELDETISYKDRYQELQRVKMYIADRNVYGIDLNPVAVELAEVSLWLNTIYKGAYVPWFGLQLVNGNSLIGARKQCYHIDQLKATRAPGRWYDSAPEHIKPGNKRKPKSQVYHFLMGDPGMANYTDKVIKNLAPDKIQAIKNWNRSFISSYSDEDIQALLRISTVVDDLWLKQVALRKSVSEKTADALSVYGHYENMSTSRTTIREKDTIYKRLYLSEKMKNAGPYARLKFAMDYWCSLWFWPIDKVDLLPSRSEFIFDMSLILQGGIVSVTHSSDIKNFQLSFIPSEREEMAKDISDLYKDLQEVDIPALCAKNQRLKLVQEIALSNKFMHWELEFADLFDERGGFDLIIGNPPWVKMEWNEQSVLSDSYPQFAIKNYSATQTTQKRSEALKSNAIRSIYLYEYESMAGMQSYLNAIQNYDVLKGSDTNLYKCFLPQAYTYANKKGVFAFVHPTTIFDEANGGKLREAIYPRLKKCFRMANELRLFQGVGHTKKFCLCIYDNRISNTFDLIVNLFAPETIDYCYEDSSKGDISGIKDKDGNWNTLGCKDRIITISQNELKAFAKILDDSDDWKQARLPVLHANMLADILKSFAKSEVLIASLNDDVYGTTMWPETGAQTNNIIERNVHFPEGLIDFICSGPHIGVANPLFQASKRNCNTRGAFDNIDLTEISGDYLQRCNYRPKCELTKYNSLIPDVSWGKKYHDNYKLLLRRRLNSSQERTLISAIYPPMTTHVHTVVGVVCKNYNNLALIAGETFSIVFDGFIKIIGKDDIYFDTVKKLPLVQGNLVKSIILRALMLNTLTANYSNMWSACWDSDFNKEMWAKIDKRLNKDKFTNLTSIWNHKTPCRIDYQRRQVLIELDVLVAMGLGLSLKQLISLYRIQFPVLQQYEADTWYDCNGRIVFTNNRSLSDVGFSRPEWNQIKDATSGKFTLTIIEDTMPGGPIERTIEYVAPFDTCDREKDYEEVWKHFEERFREK